MSKTTKSRGFIFFILHLGSNVVSIMTHGVKKMTLPLQSIMFYRLNMLKNFMSDTPTKSNFHGISPFQYSKQLLPATDECLNALLSSFNNVLIYLLVK